MQNHFTNIGLVVFIAVLLTAGIHQSKSISGGQENRSQLTLIGKLLKDEISFSGSLILDITFQNEGQEAITIYKKVDIGRFTGLFLEIKDEEGNHFPNTVFDEPMFKESSEVKIPAGDFITIRPKESLVLKRSISLQNYEIKTPGRYSATLYYDNPLPPQVVPPGVTVWNPQPGTIKTRPIHFTVER